MAVGRGPDLAARPVLIVASGPSLDPSDISLARQSGFFVIACNDNFVHDPDLLYAPDLTWIQHYKPEHPNRWTCLERTGSKIADWNEIPIEAVSQGLSKHAGSIANHGHAGAQMLSLAVQIFGAKRVALTGYDMQPTGGKTRWKGLHPEGVERGDGEKYLKWRDSLQGMAAELVSLGVEVVNCTRETALQCFPREPLESVIQRWTELCDRLAG